MLTFPPIRAPLCCSAGLFLTTPTFKLGTYHSVANCSRGVKNQLLLPGFLANHCGSGTYLFMQKCLVRIISHCDMFSIGNHGHLQIGVTVPDPMGVS